VVLASLPRVCFLRVGISGRAHMTVLHLFFSAKGRINRAKYILASLLWIFGVCLFALFYFTTDSPNSALSWILATILAVPGIWSTVVLGIKRSHDRNKTGWWMLLFYLAPYVLDNAASSAERHGNSTLGIVAEAVSFVICLWAFVELACLRGTAGPNQYGADPVTKDIPTADATGRT
jgi:uncharacterized membrane protein YhaH (DUF805 family)